MKNFSFLVLLISAILSLSVTASYAVPVAAGPAPGCDPAVWQIQKNHSDAIRVRDRAYERQIIKRNDTTLGLTCFDQAMRVTSRLGQIFSDRTPTNAPAANTDVFKARVAPGGGAGVAYADLGVTNPRTGVSSLLAVEMNSVVTPVLKESLNDFAGSLLDLADPTALLGDALNALIGSGPFAAINTAIGTVSSAAGAIGSIISTIGLINTAINRLSGVSPSIVSTILSTLRTLRGTLTSAISAFRSAVNSAMSTLNGRIRSAIGMPWSAGHATNMNCNKLEKLWNNTAGAASAYAIERGGIEKGASYMNMSAFLGGAPGMGTAFTKEVTNGSALMGRAMTDLTTLSAPGGIPSWPAPPPPFAPGTTTADIIRGM